MLKAMKSCPCCGFYNTDERERCLKCGAVLQHDWMAAQRKVRLHRFPFHRVTAAIADSYYFVRRRLAFPLPEHCPYRYPWMAGFLGLLPGLGQLYNRQNRKAVVFFAVFLAALRIAIITVLNPLSYLFIAALIAWILYSFNDAMVTATKIDGQEWSYGYTLASYSALFFYLGVFISLSQFFLVGLFVGAILSCLYSAFWSAREVNRAKILTTAGVAFGILILCCLLARSGNPVLHRWVYWSQDVVAPAICEGDFIYVDCFSYWFHPPRLGDLVYYNARPYSITQGENIYSVRLRKTIERIVALPGDHFVSRSGRFYRNGNLVPPGLEPLHPAGLPGNFEFDVPKDRYLVLISFGPVDSILGLGTIQAPAPREGSSQDWGAACLVARNEIYGRCLFIWHPVSRRRWLTPVEVRG
jgi:signal peptidase I